MAELVQQHEVLVESSTEPYVLTDSRGVVLSVNRAAAELVRQPPARRTPRPIATWFEVSDRAQIRSLISRIVSGQATQAHCRATVRRSPPPYPGGTWPVRPASLPENRAPVR